MTAGIVGDCVMYDVCNRNTATEQNCPYYGAPIVLNDTTAVETVKRTAEEILLRRCTDFFPNASTPVCCTPGQVLTMEDSIQMAEGIFGRCQTCLKNMMKGICGVACDPNQDKYLTILEERFSVQTSRNYAYRVEYRMDPDYMFNVYDTCRQVIHPSSGRQAMELACGTEATKCTPEKLFFYMGDPLANPLVPFKIEYTPVSNESIRFTSDTKVCELAYEDSYACSCSDCAESCPIAEPPQPDDRGYLIFELNGTTFIVAIIIGSFGIIALMFTTCVFGSGPKFNFDLPAFLGGFEHADLWLTKFFRWWGRSELRYETFVKSLLNNFIISPECANNPVLVLAISSWIIAGLSYGALQLQITVDPVELWANPTSRSRIEKDYFDSRFGPFYRTNQIFIKPKPFIDDASRKFINPNYFTNPLSPPPPK